MNKKIILDFLLSALVGFFMAIALIIGGVFLIVYNGNGSSYREMKIILGKIAGVIVIYMVLPVCIALIKNIVLLVADLVSQQTVRITVDLNRSTPLSFPNHNFYIIGSFKRLPPIPCGIFWTLAFSRSYYLLSEKTLQLNKNIRQNESARIIASKHSHVIYSVEK